VASFGLQPRYSVKQQRGDDIRQIRTSAAALLGAALLVACSGGDPSIPGSGAPAGAPTIQGNFTSPVCRGDSLSAIGSCAGATSLTGDGKPPDFGAKFSPNIDGNRGKVGPSIWPRCWACWSRRPRPGFAGVPVKGPITATQPALAGGCTA
jgi:hypothetical protein